MSRVRFETAAEVFETFPGAAREIALVPTDEPPLAFLRRLMAPASWSHALLFCAYTLPRRESVWWAARSARALLAPAGTDDPGLDAAEAWVRQPDDSRREAALAIGLDGDRHRPGTWIALAAGWSGGALTLDKHTANAPPDMTARTAAAGLTMAACGISPQHRFARVRACIEAGIRFADGNPLDL